MKKPCTETLTQGYPIFEELFPALLYGFLPNSGSAQQTPGLPH